MSGIGTSISAAAFAVIFYKFENSDPVVLSLVLHHILTSKIFLITCIGLYIFSVNIGFAPLKYTLLSEMFTPIEQVLVKVFNELLPYYHIYQETVAGICNTWFWMIGFCVIKLFHYFLIHFGLVIIFITISVICVGTVFFTAIFVPETRNKASEHKSEDNLDIKSPLNSKGQVKIDYGLLHEDTQ